MKRRKFPTSLFLTECWRNGDPEWHRRRRTNGDSKPRSRLNSWPSWELVVQVERFLFGLAMEKPKRCCCWSGILSRLLRLESIRRALKTYVGRLRIFDFVQGWLGCWIFLPAVRDSSAWGLHPPQNGPKMNTGFGDEKILSSLKWDSLGSMTCNWAVDCKAVQWCWQWWWQWDRRTMMWALSVIQCLHWSRILDATDRTFARKWTKTKSEIEGKLRG